MLDIHTHILPKMDDGSKSVEMSLEMLRKSREQGVTTLVSTSHYYADVESPASFRSNRAHARHKLEAALTGNEPEILYGAEVMYYPGISYSEEIAGLAIKGTDLLLIELPFIPWQSNVLDELITLQYNSRLRIVLAHVERYLAYEKKSVFRGLFDRPFYFQCNASAFLYRPTRKIALELMDSGLLHFVGTDCHDDKDRPPNMDDARKIVEKKLSPAAWKNLMEDCENRFDRHRIK